MDKQNFILFLKAIICLIGVIVVFSVILLIKGIDKPKETYRIHYKTPAEQGTGDAVEDVTRAALMVKNLQEKFPQNIYWIEKETRGNR